MLKICIILGSFDSISYRIVCLSSWLVPFFLDYCLGILFRCILLGLRPFDPGLTLKWMQFDSSQRYPYPMSWRGKEETKTQNQSQRGGLKTASPFIFLHRMVENAWVPLFEDILGWKQRHSHLSYHSLLSSVYSFLIIWGRRWIKIKELASALSKVERSLKNLHSC